jgi:hypothetical protein
MLMSGIEPEQASLSVRIRATPDLGDFSPHLYIRLVMIRFTEQGFGRIYSENHTVTITSSAKSCLGGKDGNPRQDNRDRNQQKQNRIGLRKP